MFRPRKKAAPAQVLAFCETATAGPTTPVHIRVLTDVGLKTGGGADTAALCGRVVAWDLHITDDDDVAQHVANEHETNRVCAACRDALTLGV